MNPSPLRAAAIAPVCGLLVAIGLPTMMAQSTPPSPTALNQALAVGGWGLALCALAYGRTAAWSPSRRWAGAPVAALALLGACALASWGFGALPSQLALSSAAVLLSAALVAWSASALEADSETWTGLYIALLLAGLAGAMVGAIQVFAGQDFSHPWIARSGMPGRAVGNLRQPNHLATLLLWSAVAVFPLWVRLPRLERALRTAAATALALAYAAMLYGVVLSGSRTGLLGVGALMLWGLLDRSLQRGARALLLGSPALCLAALWSLDAWASAHGTGALGVGTRLGESGDISSARFAIWRDTWALIVRNPWTGVGFGEFNFAWSLSEFPQRSSQFFDHAHNLPLHLAAELGLPLAAALLALLGLGLWQAFARSRGVPGPEGVARRAACMMVLLMAWHSQLEYPLWYAYFLLPTAFAWGLALRPADAAPPAAMRGLAMHTLIGAMLIAAAAVAVWDYSRVAAIFAPAADDDSPLVERIVEGRHSWFFAHHADYALVTTFDSAGTLPGAFDRATHFLLDTRLMTAWARAYAAQGDLERARHLAMRLREFRNPASKEFFAPCEDATLAVKPFQCTPPTRALDWRDFLPPK